MNMKLLQNLFAKCCHHEKPQKSDSCTKRQQNGDQDTNGKDILDEEITVPNEELRKLQF